MARHTANQMRTRRNLLGLLPLLVTSAVVGRDERPDALEKRIDESIRRALRWLAGEQQASGAWTTNDFGESTATTALAMMAFLSAGHVPGEGP